MELYIRTNIVHAEPQTKDGRDGYKVIDEDGLTSWSSKVTFERAYRLITDTELDLIENFLLQRAP